MKIEKLVTFVLSESEMKEAFIDYMKKKKVRKSLINHAKKNLGIIEYSDDSDGFVLSLDNVAEIEVL